MKTNEAEAAIAEALAESIRQDLAGLECPHGHDHSEVVVTVDKSKISSVKTRIHACCKSFQEQIEDALYAVKA